jgi:hypothetical protein
VIFRSIVSAAIGGLFGFLYYRFVGCRTGACVIGANPYVSTLWGATMGFLLSAK